MKRNRKYEQEIKNMFLGCLKKLDISFPVEDRKRMVWCLVRNPHWEIFSQYEDVYEDAIIWDDYDGKVNIFYKLLHSADVVKFTFGYPKKILADK